MYNDTVDLMVLPLLLALSHIIRLSGHESPFKCLYLGLFVQLVPPLCQLLTEFPKSSDK